MSDDAGKVKKTDAEWRASLTPEQYAVLRGKGTERAFTGAFWNAHEEAMYTCAGCGAELFSSDTKWLTIPPGGRYSTLPTNGVSRMASSVAGCFAAP